MRQPTTAQDNPKGRRLAATLTVILLLALAPLAASACGSTSGQPASTMVSSGPAGGTTPEASSSGTDSTANDLAAGETTEPSAETASTELFTADNWAVLDSDPGSHKGAAVDIVGKVFLTPERDSKGTYWQMWADPRDSEWNTVVYYPDPNLRIKDQDYVHVVGVVKDAFKGENAFSGTITAPAIIASTVQVVDATAAAPKAVRTVAVNLTQKQHGLSVTVDKVEFAEEETRVYITVENGSSDKASFYSFNAKAVQGTAQYEPNSWGGEYPEVQSDILPGITTSGIVVFDGMDPHMQTKIYLEARSEDYSLDFKPYVFTVPAG